MWGLPKTRGPLLDNEDSSLGKLPCYAPFQDGCGGRRWLAGDAAWLQRLFSSDALISVSFWVVLGDFWVVVGVFAGFWSLGSTGLRI